MKIQIVEFEGEKYALVREQNDWTGNYIVSVRKVRGEYGEEFIRYNERRVSVKTEVDEARRREMHIDDALKFYRDYKGRYSI